MRDAGDASCSNSSASVHLADAYAGTLSGGQRKLLELGRALMIEPRMILLDEPMAGVAPVLAEQLLDHIRELRAQRGVTVLVIEHDMDVVMSISDRVIVMDEGHVIAEGTPDEIQRERAGDRGLPRPARCREGGVMADDILAGSATCVPATATRTSCTACRLRRAARRRSSR